MSARVELRIALSDLVKAGACEGGLAVMRAIALGQVVSLHDQVGANVLTGEIDRKEVADEVVLPWDELGSAWAWSVCGDYCNWLVAKGFVPRSATAGDYGTATAGNRGTARAGDGGHAIAGEGGTATAGYGGSATAGDYGTATAGDGGTATAGYGGSATAGEEGSILIEWWDASRHRYRWAFGEVGVGGILPNVAYVVGPDGALARKDGACRDGVGVSP